MVKENKLHYAWVIFFACCILQGAAYGFVFLATGIYNVPVCAEYGCSTAKFTMWCTFISVGQMVTLPFLTKIYEKINVKVVMAFFTVVLIFSQIFLSFANNVYVWYVAGFFIGTCNTFLCSATGIILSNWFRKKYTLVLGISSAVMSICGVIINPLGTSIIDSYGWRVMCVIVAVAVALFILPVVLFIIRYKPSDMGLLPYGTEDYNNENMVKNNNLPENKFVFKEYKGVIFLLLTLGFVAAFCPGYYPLLPGYAVMIGYPAVAGSLMTSFEMAGTVVSKILIGPLTEKIGTVKMQRILTIIPIIGFSVYLITIQRIPLMICSFLCGLFMTTISVVAPACIRNTLGEDGFAKVYPLLQMISMFMVTFSQTVFAKLTEIFSTYNVMFIFCICCIIISYFLVVKIEKYTIFK